MSSGYQPKPTTATPTGAHTVQPRREPSIVGVRQTFTDTFGGYVPPEWTLDAECTRPGTDPAIFHPKSGQHSTKPALAICGACTVRDECLADALDYESGRTETGIPPGEPSGIRGGTTPRERRDLIRTEREKAVQAVKDKVIDDYRAGQLKVWEIAAKYDVNESTVTTWARAAGVPVRPRSGGRKRVA